MAALYQAQGKYAEAGPLYERALTIIEDAFGSDHPNLATGLQNYARLLREIGRSDEATQMEDRSKTIQAKNAEAY